MVFVNHYRWCRRRRECRRIHRWGSGKGEGSCCGNERKRRHWRRRWEWQKLRRVWWRWGRATLPSWQMVTNTASCQVVTNTSTHSNRTKRATVAVHVISTANLTQYAKASFVGVFLSVIINSLRWESELSPCGA